MEKNCEPRVEVKKEKHLYRFCATPAKAEKGEKFVALSNLDTLVGKCRNKTKIHNF